MSEDDVDRELAAIERAARASSPDPDADYPLVSSGEHLRKRAARRAENKRQLTVRFDQDLIDSYREMAGEGSYQRLMNRALREWITRSELEATLRRVIREELDNAREDGEPAAAPEPESGAA